jgi:hypothetical protein
MDSFENHCLVLGQLYVYSYHDVPYDYILDYNDSCCQEK